MRLHPSYTPMDPCESLRCGIRAHALIFCTMERCPHAWQRRGAEDRARRAEADRREEEATR